MIKPNEFTNESHQYVCCSMSNRLSSIHLNLLQCFSDLTIKNPEWTCCTSHVWNIYNGFFNVSVQPAFLNTNFLSILVGNISPQSALGSSLIVQIDINANFFNEFQNPNMTLSSHSRTWTLARRKHASSSVKSTILMPELLGIERIR